MRRTRAAFIGRNGELSVKNIVTVSMNPAIDKSSSVARVVAERKLYCEPPHFEPGGGGGPIVIPRGKLSS